MRSKDTERDILVSATASDAAGDAQTMAAPAQDREHLEVRQRIAGAQRRRWLASKNGLGPQGTTKAPGRSSGP